MIKIWVETDVSEFTWFLLLPRRNETPERKEARKRYVTRLEKLKLAPDQRFVFFQGILVEDDPRSKRNNEIFNLVRALRHQPAIRAAQSLTEHFGWSHVVSRQNVVTISKDRAEVLRKPVNQRLNTDDAIELVAEYFSMPAYTVRNTFYRYQRLARQQGLVSVEKAHRFRH